MVLPAANTVANTHNSGRLGIGREILRREREREKERERERERKRERGGGVTRIGLIYPTYCAHS